MDVLWVTTQPSTSCRSAQPAVVLPVAAERSAQEPQAVDSLAAIQERDSWRSPPVVLLSHCPCGLPSVSVCPSPSLCFPAAHHSCVSL